MMIGRRLFRVIISLACASVVLVLIIGNGVLTSYGSRSKLKTSMVLFAAETNSSSDISQQQVEEETRLEEQHERKHKLLQYCIKHEKTRVYNTLVHQRKHMWYNDQLGLIYCYVPKVACTNWKRVLQTFRGKLKDPLQTKDKEYIHNIHHPSFAGLDAVNINKRINMYYSFIFVRHPFERIVSAFRNKFEDPYLPYFEKEYGSTILKLFRPGLTTQQYAAGKGVKFEEFSRYIIHRVDKGKIHNLNEHWQTVELLCHPCSMRYTYIGKMETLLPDAERVLEEGNWKTNASIKFPAKARDKYALNADLELVKKYIRKLSNSTIDRLLDVYKFDFEAFGYKFHDSWRPVK